MRDFVNRKDAQAFIEANGGKTARSVSKSASHLVNNDVTSELSQQNHSENKTP